MNLGKKTINVGKGIMNLGENFSEGRLTWQRLQAPLSDAVASRPSCADSAVHGQAARLPGLSVGRLRRSADTNSARPTSHWMRSRNCPASTGWSSPAVASWQVGVIPGLLQTEEYARQLNTGYRSVIPTPPGVLERLVRVRMIRQELLGREPPLRLSAASGQGR
jgi:hypothetical protein